MKKREFKDLSGAWQCCKTFSEDDSDWNQIKVPSNWYLQGMDYSGILYYKKDFVMDRLKKDTAAYLIFHGIDYSAKIWLNGYFIGYHRGYFQRFGFNVTPFLRRKNQLVIRVNSPKESVKDWPNNKKLIKGIFNLHDTRPGGWSQKYGQDKNTGGIWNNVEIMMTSKIARISRVYLSTLKATKNKAKIKCEVKFFSKRDVKFKLRVLLKPKNFKGRTIKIPLKAITNKRGFKKFVFNFEIKNPKLWWCYDYGYPHIYEVIFEIIHENSVIDILKEGFGIRTFSMDKRQQIWLNSKKIFLRGTNFIPTQWLSEYDPAKIEKDISLLKEANINAIRVHGHINRQELYDACDTAGILVYQDFALQWGYSNSKDFIKNACSQIRDMVLQLFNHPSVIIWCCHNEPYHTTSELDIALHRIVTRTDNTRYSIHGSFLTEHAYPGWYYGDYMEFSGIPAEGLVTEFGAQALPNTDSLRKFIGKDALWPPDWNVWAYHNFGYEQTFTVAQIKKGRSISKFVKNSQEYQAELLKYAIETMRREKYTKVTGLFQFMFVDCWTSISWSVVDYYRQPKKGYYALKTAYQPVLASLEVKRRPLVTFSIKNNVEKTHILWDPRQVIWIINDTLKSYKNAKLVLTVETENGNVLAKRIKSVNIPNNSSVAVVKPARFKAIFNLNSILPSGTYVLRMIIYFRRGKISENFECFKVIKLQQI